VVPQNHSFFNTPPNKPTTLKVRGFIYILYLSLSPVVFLRCHPPPSFIAPPKDCVSRSAILPFPREADAPLSAHRFARSLSHFLFGNPSRRFLLASGREHARRSLSFREMPPCRFFFLLLGLLPPFPSQRRERVPRDSSLRLDSPIEGCDSNQPFGLVFLNVPPLYRLSCASFPPFLPSLSLTKTLHDE